MLETSNKAWLLVRVGVAFTFIYAAVSAIISPTSWVGFLPSFASSEVLLQTWGVVEIILGLWILYGKKIFIPSLVGAISLFGITIFNLPQMDIIFRDVGLFFVTLALAIESRPRKSDEETV